MTFRDPCVSHQSGKEAQCNVNEEENHGSSCEKVGHFSDSDDFKEKAEIFHDAIMAKGSDTCREKGNRLFKEKKVGLQSYTKGSRQKKADILRSAALALTVSKGENFDQFFSMEYDSMVLKTHFISL